MLANRVRMGSYKGNKYIGEVHLAQDDDFVKVDNRWVYRGSELEIEIPHTIQGEKITTYNYMFHGTGDYSATPVTRVDSNNKKVTQMADMFFTSSAATLGLSSFDTSNVTNMSYMFYMSKITTLDLSSFDTSSVTNMNYMFYHSEATTLDVSSFDTSNVTRMLSLFYASRATTLDLSSFDTSNVTNMSSMFYKSYATAIDLSSFDTSRVTNMSNMFRDSSATTLDLSSFDTSNVTDMSYMFWNSKATTGYARTQADADRFNASSYKPAGLTFVPVLATDNDFEGTANGSFRYIGTEKVVRIPHVIKGVPVTSYNNMFETDNGKLVEKVISYNGNVTNMSYMFSFSKATTLDLSSFDTSNVTNMSFMFEGSSATTLDLSSFDTSNVTNMSYMFNNSSATTGYARTQADADKFNTSSSKPAGLTFIVKP